MTSLQSDKLFIKLFFNKDLKELQTKKVVNKSQTPPSHMLPYADDP
jgi:hypothetical protein